MGPIAKKIAEERKAKESSGNSEEVAASVFVEMTESPEIVESLGGGEEEKKKEEEKAESESSKPVTVPSLDKAKKDGEGDGEEETYATVVKGDPSESAEEESEDDLSMLEDTSSEDEEQGTIMDLSLNESV